MVETILDWIKEKLGIRTVQLKQAGNDMIRTFRVTRFPKRFPVYDIEHLKIEINAADNIHSAWVQKDQLVEIIEHLLHANTEESIKIGDFYDFSLKDRVTEVKKCSLEAKSSLYKNKIELIFSRYKKEGRIYGLPTYALIDKRIFDKYLNLVKGILIDTEKPEYNKAIELIPTLNFRIVVYYCRAGVNLYEN